MKNLILSLSIITLLSCTPENNPDASCGCMETVTTYNAQGTFVSQFYKPVQVYCNMDGKTTTETHADGTMITKTINCN